MYYLTKAVALSAIAAALMAAAPATAQVTPATGNAMAATQVPVAKLDNPRQLTGAGVLDASSKPIGKVAGVKTGSDGKADRVRIALITQQGMGRVASVKAEKLSFDRSKGVVVANLSAAEVAQLASSASSMAPGGGGTAGGPMASGGGTRAN
jgi:hypothetical protein